MSNQKTDAYKNARASFEDEVEEARIRKERAEQEAKELVYDRPPYAAHDFTRLM